MKTGIATALFPLAALAIIAGCQATPPAKAETMQPPAAASSNINRLLTNITSPDPEIQMMSLVLTRAAQTNGMSPRLMLCGPAGELALKTPPGPALTTFPPSGRSPDDLLSGLIASGATVEVCALFLPTRNLTEEALREGVGVATPASIAEDFSAPDTRVISF